MRLALLQTSYKPVAGVVIGDQIVNLQGATIWNGTPLDLIAAGESTARKVAAAVESGGLPAQAVIPIAGAQFKAPIPRPGKIVVIGLNYRDHAAEGGAEPPDVPIVFAKFPSAVIGHGEAIRTRPEISREVDYEAELAVIIGREARDVPADEALSYVFGYTCGNDVSARDVENGDQWMYGKSFDTFCPLGPWIVTADEIPDPQALGIECRVNGRVLQRSNTREMIFSVAELVAYVTRGLTLYAGDVIMTGTPAGVGFARTPPVWLQPGDTVDVEIERIGVLSNPVA